MVYQVNRWFLGFTACAIYLASTGVHAEYDFSMSVGAREDDLHWSISALGGSPNVLSELTWRELRSHYFKGQLRHSANGVMLRGDVGYGQIYSGYNQDSDYDGDNRTLEFSRSNNTSDGDSVSDAGLAIGFDLLDPTVSDLQVTPFFGYSNHQQKLRMTDGFQTIPALGAFEGLNSTYQTQWSGPMIGVDASLKLNPQFLFRATYEHHFAEYYAKANWNLRDCLDHPTSYEHEGAADGDNIKLSAEVGVTADMAVLLMVDFTTWAVDSGRTYFFLPPDFYTRRDSGGGLVCISVDVPSADRVYKIYEPLNEVKWRASVFSVGINMRL